MLKLTWRQILALTATLFTLTYLGCTKPGASNEELEEQNNVIEKRGAISPENKKEKLLSEFSKSNQDVNEIRSSTSSTSSTTSSGCGSSFAENYYSTGYYAYPHKTLDLTSSPQGLKITISVGSNDVPNKFDIYDGNGNFVTSSGWMGYATYSGPWGQSLNAPQTKLVTFIRGTLSQYTLRVFTSTQSYSDNWYASVSCETPLTSTMLKNDTLFSNLVNSTTAIYANLENAFSTFTSAQKNAWYDSLDVLGAKQNLTFAESQQYAQLFRVSSMNDLNIYAQLLNGRVKKLKDKYSQMNNATLAIQDSIKKASQLVELPSYMPLGCHEIFLKCKASANAEYHNDVVSCVEGSLSVGFLFLGVSTPLGGFIAGGGYALTCGYSIMRKRHAAVDACIANYNGCANN